MTNRRNCTQEEWDKECLAWSMADCLHHRTDKDGNPLTEEEIQFLTDELNKHIQYVQDKPYKEESEYFIYRAFENKVNRNIEDIIENSFDND